MGQEEYQIDTNIVIASLDKTLPEKDSRFVGNLPILLSVITRIELLGWLNAPQKALSLVEDYLNDAIVYSLDEPTILKTIDLRQKFKLKTPDGIIAATAIVADSFDVDHHPCDTGSPP